MQIKRGDTIIEVIFSIAIFGLVSIVTLNIMQRAMMAGQLALEASLTRQAMDSQAEAIRFLSAKNKNRTKDDFFANRNEVQKYILKSSEFKKIIKMEEMTKMNDDTGVMECSVPDDDKKAFVIDVYDNNLPVKSGAGVIKNATVYPRLVHKGSEEDGNLIGTTGAFIESQGLYVQAIKVDDGVGDKYSAIDYYIKACWQTPASPQPVTLATIVRLYDK